MIGVREIPLETDQLRHAWKGEWSHFNNGPTSTFGTYATDDRHYVWIPNGTTEMQVAFTSLEWNTDNAQIAQIRPNIDLGEDGNDDAVGQGTKTGDTCTSSWMWMKSTGASGVNLTSLGPQFRCSPRR